jgi:hypothetical protein
MTIVSLAKILLLLLIPIAIVRFYYFWSKEELVRIQKYKLLTDQFFNVADEALSKPGLPDRFLNLIESVNELIGDWRVPLVLLLRHTKPKQEWKREPFTPEFEAFCKANPDFCDRLMNGVESALRAFSYANGILGPVIRLLDKQDHPPQRHDSLIEAEGEVEEVYAKVHNWAAAA